MPRGLLQLPVGPLLRGGGGLLVEVDEGGGCGVQLGREGGQEAGQQAGDQPPLPTGACNQAQARTTHVFSAHSGMSTTVVLDALAYAGSSEQECGKIVQAGAEHLQHLCQSDSNSCCTGRLHRRLPPLLATTVPQVSAMFLCHPCCCRGMLLLMAAVKIRWWYKHSAWCPGAQPANC
jgi:hypothetical protein